MKKTDDLNPVIEYCDRVGSIEYKEVEGGGIVLMGSTVEKVYRRQGIFRKLLTALCTMFDDRQLYAAVKNKQVVPLFMELGFELTMTPIPHWGSPRNCILLQRPPVKKTLLPEFYITEEESKVLPKESFRAFQNRSHLTSR